MGMPVIPAHGKLRQEDCHKFEASVGYTGRSYLKKKTAREIKTDREKRRGKAGRTG